MSKRKVVALALLWALILILQGYWLFESQRMTRASAAARDEQATRGAQIYAQNCMVCHGPVGEGIIGPPLNREEFRAEGKTGIQVATIQDFLTKTIARGRPGFDRNTWQIEGGKIHSYTRMPTWATSDNGPLNEQQIRDLVTFLMYGDWKEPSKYAAAPEVARLTVTEYVTNPDTGQQEPRTRAVTAEDLDVKAAGLTDEENQEAKKLFVTMNCVQCHTLGSYGGVVGPNLTRAGEWLPSQEFVERWIANPQAFAPWERMPSVWHGQGTPVDLTETYRKEQDKFRSIMPAFENAMSPEQIRLLARFLMGLGDVENRNAAAAPGTTEGTGSQGQGQGGGA
ncbi:cytochrome c class I [Thermaerobacter marianensis DSM 12885]|uniref:Cytochrome c class I n=1 Tax=Thermaerobacter marianensis (strain ATCC 700841 / DSM 12885 / JCM 10246 / 7p75a) TaxID=644966 RepID=E6SMI6_THEM7|nr:c-type cytochrome [Thermaerobacter marianensis]ADU50446.1 cytochrome c class I [Thermaerobacter marianensis DSM 12885]